MIGVAFLVLRIEDDSFYSRANGLAATGRGKLYLFNTTQFALCTSTCTKSRAVVVVVRGERDPCAKFRRRE